MISLEPLKRPSVETEYNMKVAVGLSGGIDSSVAALLLKEQGHDVIGITMAIWSGKYSGGGKNACYGPDEAEDIIQTRKFCDRFGIPYHVFYCAEEYEELVLENFREEYGKARTPNPCVLCNHLMKFGVLLEMARKEGVVFDRFATGHYACSDFDPLTGRFLLTRSQDTKKDQTYFLYRLSQEQLALTLFPLGGMTKEEVRKIAADYGLASADKKESQDFYGGDYRELLDYRECRGKIVDLEGSLLGTHQGVWNYTPGQRRGLGISRKGESQVPLYVVSMDGDSNEITVGSYEQTLHRGALISNTNLIAVERLTGSIDGTVKIRSSGAETAALLSPAGNGALLASFEEPLHAVSPGQSAVFYRGDVVLGGGIIDKVVNDSAELQRYRNGTF